MLALRDVHAAYGLGRALHGVTLDVAEGEIVALLGRNGAGKSTTLKAVMGLVDVVAGDIAIRGRAVRGLPTYEISRLGVGYVPEDRRVFADLSVRENLMVGERPGGRWTLGRVLGLFPALGDLLDRRGGSLSGGEQQMLTVARTLLTDPSLLLLDEPSEGLAPLVVRGLGDALSALKREGLTIVLAEQNLKLARRLADRVYLIEKGQIRFAGRLADLDADPALRQSYLGV